MLLTGATGGLGEAIARELGGRGAKLILTGRRTDVLEGLAGELGARALAADLADRAAVDRLLSEAGAVDILVANAALPGRGAPGRIRDGGDRPHAGGQPARPDRDGARTGAGDGEARRRATCCSSPRCRGRRPPR